MTDPTDMTLPGLVKRARRDPASPIAASSAKRGFDIFIAAGALLLLLPLFAIIALLILLAEGRPIFIRHSRLGHGSKLFGCLKFRTMRVDADAILQAHLAATPDAGVEWAATRKLKIDPRVTALGSVLRKSSLDELPQLINIIKGEMSLVGPRPIVLDEVRHYGVHIRQYEQVKPGLTGLWQVGGRSDVSYRHRVELDCDYVANWSFGRDLAIIAKTVPAVLRSQGSY